MTEDGFERAKEIKMQITALSKEVEILRPCFRFIPQYFAKTKKKPKKLNANGYWVRESDVDTIDGTIYLNEFEVEKLYEIKKQEIENLRKEFENL